MSRTWLSGLALLAFAAVGCGGALSGGTGGTGGGGILTGGAGTTGSGGAAGRGPYEGGYPWGDSWVSVGPSETAPTSFKYMAQEDIAIKAMVSLPPATDWPPTNGARLTAHYGCGPALLYGVDVNSCAIAPNGTTPAGCVAFSVDDQGVMTGEYADGAGARCAVQSGAVNIQLPLPEFAQPAGAPHAAASGSFNFFCNRPDGARWYVSGNFAIPAQSTTLLWVD